MDLMSVQAGCGHSQETHKQHLGSVFFNASSVLTIDPLARFFKPGLKKDGCRNRWVSFQEGGGSCECTITCNN